MARLVRLAVVIPLIFLAACQQKVNDANFKKLAQGMTMREVEMLLGKGEKQVEEGTSIGGAGLAERSKSSEKLSTYLYKEDSREITVTFKDGKVVDMNKRGF